MFFTFHAQRKFNFIVNIYGWCAKYQVLYVFRINYLNTIKKNIYRCRVPEFDDNTTNYDTPFEMSVANHLFAKPTLVSNAHIYCYYCNVSFITEKRNCTEELTKNKCSQYIYDKSQFHTSVVSLVRNKNLFTHYICG